ncbi:MAG: DUF2304 domain-containing protein [Deltaproteobacteria bacterium]|nr:DUF2304 domain-containing protein [Deltaproteobacteria bacterium]
MQPLPLALAVLLLAVVLELVRRRRLREEFSWLWVAGAGAMLVLSLWPSARERVARLLDSSAEGTGVLLLAILFLCGIVLHLSTRVSTLANQNRTLAQHVAGLEKRAEDLEAGDEP